LTNVGTSAFHAERRWCVLARDFFRFGTAMILFFPWDFSWS